MTLDARIRVERRDWSLDVALEVAAGEVVAMLGPNGAGKSTTIAALAGTEELAGGHIALGERVLDHVQRGVSVPASDRNIGVVFQDGRLFPHLDARDNVAFGLRCRGVSRSRAHTAAREWLARVGVADRSGAHPDQLSGGEAQRVAIARALATDPDLLLLDEPLAAVDAAARSHLREILRGSIRGGRPVVLVTQDLVDAALLADRVVVVEAGKVSQQGSLEDVTRRPRSAWAARLVGVNLLRGVSDGDTVNLPGGERVVAVDAGQGEVFVAIHPHAVALHPARPEGTPRNVWGGRVGQLDTLGGRVRVTLDGALPLVAEVTPSAVRDLRLAPGREVWAAVKATEVETYPV